ncbi:AtpZ/AtpI family protein [Pelosinus sp. IPA-1]|uniref:AtpZ/AtpI family protein n=1 Tax=Pelosinus sp. IPA-1 TaxID=3029569 RepID=UPI002553EB79|nr:AtpZ/AtpI family protein [Pelosinus sp. IPA-1]
MSSFEGTPYCEEIAMQKKDKNELFSGINTAATIGFYMVSSVAAGVLLGKLVDKYLDSSPWATIVGIILGMIAGMWSMYKRLVGGK